MQHSKEAAPLKSRRIGLVAASLAVALAFVLVVFGSNLATDDDMGIALALSGLYPDSGLSLFVNAIVSRLTLLVSSAFPGVNAFYLIEYCLAAVGIFVFVYVAMVYIDDRVVALCAIGMFVLLLISGCTFRKNFTVVAAVISLSGFFALVMQVCKGRLSAPMSIVAVVLCVFGFMIRWESFLLTVPFAAIALAYTIWVRAGRVGWAPSLKGAALGFVPFMVVVLLCAAAYAYNAVEWSNPEWDEWKSYNHARSSISDYPMPDYAEIEEELTAGGIAEIDYSFARTWRTADKDVFTIETLEFIASFSEDVGDEVIAEKMVKKAQVWAVKYWYAMPIIVALLVMYVLRAKKLSARANVAVAITAVVFLAAALYLASGGRLKQRVMYPLIVDAVVFLAVIVGNEVSIGIRHRVSKGSGRKRRIACALGLLFCVVCAGYAVYSSHPGSNLVGSEGDGEEAVVQPGISEYVREHDDALFVVDAQVEYRYLVEYGMVRIPARDELMRLFFLGGWSTGSPYINARNEAMDMDNVMKGLVENERACYLVPQSNKQRVSEMEVYLETHYWSEVTTELVDSFEANGVTYYVYDFDVAA